MINGETIGVSCAYPCPCLSGALFNTDYVPSMIYSTVRVGCGSAREGVEA